MYRIATVFELASVCPPPQGLSGAPNCFNNLYHFQYAAAPYLLKGYKVIVGGSRTEKFQLCEFHTSMEGLTPIMNPELVDIDESETYVVFEGYVFRGAADYSSLP